MMNLLQRLFRRKTVDLEELKEALQSVEKDRRRTRIEMRRWERQRKRLMERLKQSRSEANQVETDYLWDELKTHRTAGNDLRREARTFNIEGIAVKRYIRAVEQLERRNDREGSRRLFERIRASGLTERLAVDREAEVACLRELASILDEFDGTSDEEHADPEKALFLAELDAIRAQEREGRDDDARDREDELLERFQQQEPEGEARSEA